MTHVRSPIEERERKFLCPYATYSEDSLGRCYSEPEHPYRGPFQRDRDRILHCSAFRRLSGKTQVFTGSHGDYHRNRLTHTMEVASIARTIGRALGLNEDLIEALALLHDIGHPPFGHAGEDALAACLEHQGGFSHNEFALTIVTELERPYPKFPGLNLSKEVLAAQQFRANKLSERTPALEAQVVDLADSIAYDSHDVDDAAKLNLLTMDDLTDVTIVKHCYQRVLDRFPQLEDQRLRQIVVHELIDIQVNSIIQNALSRLQEMEPTSAMHAQELSIRLDFDGELVQQIRELESFLYEHVYRHPELMRVRSEAQSQLHEMFEYLTLHPEIMPIPFQRRAESVGTDIAVRDYIAGMTDNFCLEQYKQILGTST